MAISAYPGQEVTPWPMPANTTLPISWRAERAKIAGLTRSRAPDDPELIAARRRLRACRAADYLRTTLAAQPPLSPGEVAELAAILREGVGDA